MGVMLRISARGMKAFSRSISSADWSLVERLREVCPSDVAVIFGQEDESGSEARVALQVILASAQRVVDCIESNSDLWPMTFQFKTEHLHPIAASSGYQTGAISGIRLTGDEDHWYMLRAGVNKCCLRKVKGGPADSAQSAEEIDVRDRHELMTETHGRIRIRKVKRRTELRECVSSLVKYLGSLKEDTVVRALA